LLIILYRTLDTTQLEAITMGSFIVEAQEGPRYKAVKPNPPVDVDGLIAQLRVISDDPSVLSGVHVSQRQELQRLSLAAARSLEQPFDTMMRIMYSVRASTARTP
jgi:hypothetical protein